VSERLWRGRHGGAEDLLGRGIELNGELFTVIGIAPDALRFPPTADLWASPRFRLPEHPLRPAQDPLAQPGSQFLHIVARLAPGWSAERAAADLDTVSRFVPLDDQVLKAGAIPLHDHLVGPTRAQLWIVFAAVGLILLIACVNVAHLVLARALGRRHEVAVRIALGASRARLVKLFVAESAMLSALGAALGLLVALWGAPPLLALAPEGLRELPLALDARVLLFTIGVAAVTSIVFGVTPALSAPLTALRETHVARRRGLRSLLVAAEVALAVVVVIGAALLARSFGRLAAVDPGFGARAAISGDVWLPFAQYPERDARARFHARVVEELLAVPGVEAAGAVSRLPLSGGNSTRDIGVGRPEAVLADLRAATPGYFDALGIPIVAGRTFRAGERPRPVIVNQRLARAAWPDESPLGKIVNVDLDEQPSIVVGVIGDVLHTGLDGKRRAEIYVAAEDDPWPFMTFVARGGIAPAQLAMALRRAVERVDPTIALARVSTIEERIDGSLEQRRFAMMVVGVLAGLALVLALIGVYGVIAHAVAQRTRELGIRVALGAGPRAVLGLVVGQSMRPVLAGLALGLAGALAASRALAGLLYGVAPSDPATYAFVCAALAAAAALTSVAAARRATRVDPMVALRSE
jgi:putative ABC transport system permease protein